MAYAKCKDFFPSHWQCIYFHWPQIWSWIIPKMIIDAHTGLRAPSEIKCIQYYLKSHWLVRWDNVKRRNVSQGERKSLRSALCWQPQRQQPHHKTTLQSKVETAAMCYILRIWWSQQPACLNLLQAIYERLGNYSSFLCAFISICFITIDTKCKKLYVQIRRETSNEAICQGERDS